MKEIKLNRIDLINLDTHDYKQFMELSSLVKTKKYKNAIKLLCNIVKSKIKKRILYSDIEVFLSQLKPYEYNKTLCGISQRLDSVRDSSLIKQAFNLNFITSKMYQLIKLLFWYRDNHLTSSDINTDEIHNLINFITNTLFKDKIYTTETKLDFEKSTSYKNYKTIHLEINKEYINPNISYNWQEKKEKSKEIQKFIQKSTTQKKLAIYI